LVGRIIPPAGVALHARALLRSAAADGAQCENIGTEDL
jgi:hypothetical protein